MVISLHRLTLVFLSSDKGPTSERNWVSFCGRLEFFSLLELMHLLLRLLLILVELADTQRIRVHCSDLGWEYTASSVRDNTPVDATKESMLLDVVSISNSLAKAFARVSVQ